MIMGSWISFKPNGTGEFESWSSGEDETSYNFNGKFDWKRINKNTIQIKENENNNTEIITYKIERENGKIELKNAESRIIGKTEMEEFWNFSQTVFKS